MRWLGHHIWDFVSRFRNKIYMDHYETGTTTNYVVREADGQLKVRDRGTTVNTTGTPVANDFAKFTDADTIEGRSYTETKTDLSLGNVENTAISTWTGSTNVTTLGTIGTGTWNGTAIGISKGGTGATTAQAAMNALAGGTTAGRYLKGNGSNVTLAAISNSDIGTLNQDTTGLAGTATALATARNINGVSFNGTADITVTAAGSTLSDTVPVGKGGTGATTLTADKLLTGNGTGAIQAEAGLSWASSQLSVAGDIKYTGTLKNVDSEGADAIPSVTTAKNILVNDAGETKQQTRANFMGNLSAQAAAAFSMNSQKITSLATPVASTDAATKGYIDGRKITDLTAPTSDVAMNSQKITGVATPTASTDAATKGYADRQTSRVSFVYANMKGNFGTTETYIPLAGVPDEKVGFTNEQVVLIMPVGGYVKELIIRANYGTYTSENIVIKAYRRPKNKKMNGQVQIGSDITVAAPTQNGTDDNNTRSTGDLGTAIPYTKGDALGISFTWQTTGPGASTDKTYITVVIEENLSDLGY